MKTQPNLSDADAFYEQLLDAHTNLDREASELLNARLILLLANQIGDNKVPAGPGKIRHSSFQLVTAPPKGSDLGTFWGAVFVFPDLCLITTP